MRTTIKDFVCAVIGLLLLFAFVVSLNIIFNTLIAGLQ